MSFIWLGVAVILVGIGCLMQSLFLASLLRRLDEIERRLDWLSDIAVTRLPEKTDETRWYSTTND